MLCVLMIHIVMDIFEITISMINYLLYVIIIMLIYGIKIIWKMHIFLTVTHTKETSSNHFILAEFGSRTTTICLAHNSQNIHPKIVN
jgi:hypothetical protein